VCSERPGARAESLRFTVTYRTENGQQLRLRELVLAETGSLRRENRPADLQGDASTRQESDFGHRPSCLQSKQQFGTTGYLELSSP
jgi:hypothetical protein